VRVRWRWSGNDESGHPPNRIYVVHGRKLHGTDSAASEKESAGSGRLGSQNVKLAGHGGDLLPIVSSLLDFGGADESMMGRNQTADQRATRGAVSMAVWTIVWMTTLAVATFGPSFLWDSQPVASWIAVAANFVVGVGWVVAHARYLRGLDELQRKIQVDALAVALGAGLVAGFAYAAASIAGLIADDANIALFSVLVAVVYVIAIAVGNLRYR